MRFAYLLVLLSVATALSFAANPLNSVNSAVSDLCGGLTSLLPVAAMLGVVLAGVIYAAGQMMGAETRARANVWATAALTGALIAVLIAVVAPAVLQTIYGQNITCTATGGSGGNGGNGGNNGVACGSSTCSSSQSCCNCDTLPDCSVHGQICSSSACVSACNCV